MKNEIVMRRVLPVKSWNAEKLAQGEYMQAYTLGNGSMVDILRKNGYVVEKEHKQGSKKSRFFLSIDDAMEYYRSFEF